MRALSVFETSEARVDPQPFIKESMPPVTALAPEPLDRVAYANPLGYLPEIRALLMKGADPHALMTWAAKMETIATYAAARVHERAVTERVVTRLKKGLVESEDTFASYGDLHVAENLQVNGVLVVLGDLHMAVVRSLQHGVRLLRP